MDTPVLHVATEPQAGSPVPQPGHHARLIVFGVLCLGSRNLNDADVAKVPEWNAMLSLFAKGQAVITLS